MDKKRVFIDPNIERKSKIYDASFKFMEEGVPLPAIIEVSNSGVCNRECSFCPRSDPNYNHVNEFFSNELHDKLCDELDDVQFGNMLYTEFSPQGREFHIVEPIIKSPKLRITSLFRIKANMNPRTQEIIKHGFHLDVPYNETTAIYYVNSNDGYTEFEDGTKVESVANRLVKFNSNIRHTGTTCTDSKIRCLINFNYTSSI